MDSVTNGSMYNKKENYTPYTLLLYQCLITGNKSASCRIYGNPETNRGVVFEKKGQHGKEEEQTYYNSLKKKRVFICIESKKRKYIFICIIEWGCIFLS